MHFFKEAKEDLPSFPWEDADQLRSVSSDMAEWVYHQNYPILLEVSKSGGMPSMRQRYQISFVSYAYALFQKEPPLEETTSAFSSIFDTGTLFGSIPGAAQYLVDEHAPLPSVEQLYEEEKITSRLRELLFSFYNVAIIFDDHNDPHLEVDNFELPNPQPNGTGKKEWHTKLSDLQEMGVYLADVLEWYADEAVKKQVRDAAERFIESTEKYLRRAHWTKRQPQLHSQRRLLYHFFVSGNRDLLKEAKKLPTHGLDTSEQAYFHRVLDAALTEGDLERCRFHIRYMTPYPFRVW